MPGEVPLSQGVIRIQEAQEHIGHAGLSVRDFGAMSEERTGMRSRRPGREERVQYA